MTCISDGFKELITDSLASYILKQCESMCVIWTQLDSLQ